jgi:MFS family permease
MKNLPIQVWRLMLTYALMMAGTSLTVLIAGIIGSHFAPSPGLATLPVALSIVGLATSTLPTGRLQHRYGRRKVFIGYGFLAVAAALLAALSLVQHSFVGFCVATVMMGWSAAAGHQYRFAAMECVSAEQAPKATSVLLFGGILAAVVGPEIAVRGQFLLATPFAGSYLLLACIYILGIFLMAFYRDARAGEFLHGRQGRPLREVIRSPVITLAIAASALGYGVMSFVMTAGPVSMHEHAGHSMQATKWVLQSHIAAMYLPSLVYPWLYSRMGYRGLMWTGVAALLACLFIGSLNTDFLHFWLTMVILGVGWNFLFLSGTNLLRYGYRDEERFKVQSFNDFLVFSIQGVASLGSGWFLYHWGWQGVLYASAPLVLLFALLAWTIAIPRTLPAAPSRS